MKRNEKLIQIANLASEKRKLTAQIEALEERLEEVNDELDELDCESTEKQLNRIFTCIAIFVSGLIASELILMFLN